MIIPECHIQMTENPGAVHLFIRWGNDYIVTLESRSFWEQIAEHPEYSPHLWEYLHLRVSFYIDQAEEKLGQAIQAKAEGGVN